MSEDSDNDVQPMGDALRWKLGILLGSILLVALCSIIYELIIGTLSSYLLGNSVYQFSLVIGIYMSAMGLGSYISKFFEDELLEKFFWVEIGIGLLGGTCAALLFGVFAFSPYFQQAIWGITIAIGTLVGLEIPLLTRYVRQYSQLRDAIANVLSWDYIGALFGSVSFPILLLPALGILNSAAVIGLVNIAVAVCGILVFRNEIKRFKLLLVAALGVAAVLIGLFFSAGAYERFLDKKLFVDPVVFKEQTQYQSLTMTNWMDDYRLYINGNIQFSSRDEYRYHEALVVPAMSIHGAPKSIGILGGGDGLAVKQIIKFPTVETITMVDLDPRMTEISRAHPALKRLNEGAFENDKLKVVNADAMQYLIDNPDKRFDVLIIDLPDPNNESLAKLYSREFYRIVRSRLNDGGLMVTQSSSSYHSPRAFWSIHRTVEESFCTDEVKSCESRVLPYHTWIPAFSDWGFNLASKNRDIDWSKAKFEVPLKYFNESVFASARNFPPDIAELDVKPNRLIEPILLRYYERDWKRHNP